MRDKPFIGICHVSSDEQEDQGHSLDVQESMIRAYARNKGYTLQHVHRLTESAADPKKRPQFRKILNEARANAEELGGIIWCYLDRASRNMEDQMELFALHLEDKLAIEFVIGDFDVKTAIGELMMTVQGAQARFHVRNLAERVQRSVELRARQGYFVGRAPFGYRNVRICGRAAAEVHPANALAVRRIFELYADSDHVLDSLVEALRKEGFFYSQKQPRFRRKHLHDILRNRAYLGEVKYKGEWYPGAHEPIVDPALFRRVQVKLGGRTYTRHSLLFSHGLLRCGACGRKVTGERKEKQLASGMMREYVYYRCAKYSAKDHPQSARVREDELNGQVLELFDRLQVDDPQVREWFGQALRARAGFQQARVQEHLDRLSRRLERVRSMLDELLNLRLNLEIGPDQYKSKRASLQDEKETLKEQIDALDLNKAKEGNLVVATFELSQHLKERWLGADQAAKRQLLRILGLNWTLEGKTLVPTLRKPFDVLAMGLVGAEVGDGDP